MKHIPTIKTVMTAFPWSISHDAAVEEAWAMMNDHDIRHLPVTHGDEIVGLISQRDLLLAESLISTADTGGPVSVELMCRPDPFVVDYDRGLDEVVLAMADKQIGSALVTRDGKLVGILTTTDVCRLLGETLRALLEPPEDEVA